VLGRLKAFAFNRRSRSEASAEPNIAKCDLPLPKPIPAQTPILDATPVSDSRRRHSV
jgi:hypothetical protein